MQILSFTYEQLKNIRLKDFFLRLYKKSLDEEDLTSVAAQVAFYFSFALFPLLLFLLSVFGIVMGTDNDLRTEMFFYLQQVMPNSAFDLVRKTIERNRRKQLGRKADNRDVGRFMFGFGGNWKAFASRSTEFTI